MRPIVFEFDTGAGPNLIRAYVLYPSGLGSFRQRDMPGIQSVPDTKLKSSRTITFHLGMGKSLTRIKFGLVNELVVLVLLETI